MAQRTAERTATDALPTFVPLPPVLQWFWAGTALVFALMFFVGYARYRAGEPMAHCNLIGTVHSTDLMEYVPTFKLLHTAAFFRNPHTNPVAYPPFGAIFYQALYATGHPIAAFLAWGVLWISTLSAGMALWLRREGIQPLTAVLFPATVLAMAFPVLGMLCYGNIELFLWVFAAGGMWAFVHRRPRMAGVLWGCAAAMKLYPIILLLLLANRKQWRAVGWGAYTFGLVTLASLRYLGPTVAVAWHGSIQNVFGYQGVRQEEWSLHELATNHSAFTWVKLMLRIAGRPFAGAMLPYYACGALVFAVVFLLRVRKLPLPNQVLAITGFMLLFPPISYLHTLVHLFATLALLAGVALRAQEADCRVVGLWPAFLFTVPLLASFMLLTEPQWWLFGGLVQGLLLMGLIYVAARFPLAVSQAAEGREAARLQAASGWGWNDAQPAELAGHATQG